MSRLLILAALVGQASFVGSLSLPGFGGQVTGISVTDSTITVFRRETSNLVYAVVGCDPCSPPDRVWKEVYRAKGGRIYLDTTIAAQVVNNARETITWPEEE